MGIQWALQFMELQYTIFARQELRKPLLHPCTICRGMLLYLPLEKLHVVELKLAYVLVVYTLLLILLVVVIIDKILVVHYWGLWW